MGDTVLFDLDGTIVDHVGAASRAVAAWAADIAPTAGGDVDLAGLWAALEREHFAAYLAGECSFQQQRRQRVRGFLPQLGLPVDEARLDEQFRDYLAHYEASWTVFPDVVDTLVALRGAGYRLAVLTNGDAGQQRRKLARTGLGDAFDLVLCSSELGVAKPDPRVFLVAARRLDRHPETIWYVGDDLHVDYAAARQAGLNGAWLNRLARPGDLPAVRIGRLTELPGLLPAVPGPPAPSPDGSWASALGRFADLVDGTVTWALGGSAALALYGVAVSPHDVDVITDQAGISTILRRVVVGTVDEPFVSSDVAAEARLRFALDGVEFDVLVAPRTRRPDDSWSVGTSPVERTWLPWPAGKMPVLPLSTLDRIAGHRNRIDQRAGIRGRLRQLGIADHALPS